MNFNEFNFDDNLKNSLQSLDIQNRMPHAIVIESKDSEQAEELAKFISMWAVCNEQSKPCGVCANCHNAKNAEHADIYYAFPEKKSKIYTIEQMRAIIKSAYIKPNSAVNKVYIFKNADKCFPEITQNAFLKLLEEPPSNVLFILICENSNSLLTTILSRCTVFRLKNNYKFNDEALQNAKTIVKSMTSSKEYDLLLALNCLTNKDLNIEILQIVKILLCDALTSFYTQNQKLDFEISKSVASRFNKTKIIQMIELTEKSKQLVSKKINININLLTTWLCGEYRRISWQR